MKINFFIILGLLLGNVAVADHVRLISVNGVAEKSYTPDIAFVQVSVWGKAENAKNAQNLANKENENLHKMIDQFKIKKEDVQTVGFDISPEYFYDTKTNVNKIVGHKAVQTLSIKFKDIASIGKFLDQAVRDENNSKAGTSVNFVSWDLEKRKELTRDLLNEAVVNASELAIGLSKAANVKVKSLYHLTPQDISSPMPMYRGEMMMSEAKAKSDSPETTLNSGEIKLKAQVSADYEIE